MVILETKLEPDKENYIELNLRGTISLAMERWLAVKMAGSWQLAAGRHKAAHRHLAAGREFSNGVCSLVLYEKHKVMAETECALLSH